MQLVGLPSQIPCPRCAAPMVHLNLDGHRGRTVVVDHCQPCRLVWFDALESVGLGPMGWVRLLAEMQHGSTRDLPASQDAQLGCPSCRAPLKPVHNRTRFGRFLALECPQRHGHLHSHSGLLAERGLVRPLLPPERAALAEEQRRLDCLNCGAPSDGSAESCRHCGSPLVVVDLERLDHALRYRPLQHGDAPAPAGRHIAWPCRSCGAPLDPSRHAACPQCGHTVVVPSLLDLTPLLKTLEAELQAEAKAAAEAAPAPRPRARRARSWRDTGVARLLHLARQDAHAGAEEGGWAVIVILVLAALAWLLLA
jgi:ribosomal protein L40E